MQKNSIIILCYFKQKNGGSSRNRTSDTRKGNRYSTTVIVAPISSRITKNDLPTHVIVQTDFLEKKSVILLEQIRTIDKKRIDEKLGVLPTKLIAYLYPILPTLCFLYF